MFSRTVRAPLVFLLLLALLMGWGSHAAAWLGSPLPSEISLHGHGHGHGHAHCDAVEDCATCPAAQGHPHPGDHLHEAPHPLALVRLLTQTERPRLRATTRDALAQGPIFRIERPPRTA